MKKRLPDHLVVLRIGKMVKAARKHLGWNQIAVAPQLGLDQSALSRVESGKQMLTTAQWLTFCEISGIFPEAMAEGTIELDHPESAIRLPERYSFERHTKIRSLVPMLEFAQNALGERGYESFFRDKKIDTDYFLNLNAEINFNFTLDLFEILIKKTGMKARDAETVTRTAGQGTAHGSLRRYYDHIFTNQLNLISGFVSNSTRYYGSDFDFEVLDATPTQLDVAVTPQPHMKNFNYRSNPVLGDSLAYYDKGFFQNLSTYGGQNPLDVRILENHYQGAKRCLYRMKSVGR